MGVNAVIDNTASQQMAVALQNNVAAEVDRLSQKDLKDAGKQKVELESEVAKTLLEATSGSKAGMNILINLASKLATTAGVTLKPERFSGRAQEELENEFGRLLGGENFEDMVEIQREVIAQIGKQSSGQGNRGKGQQEKEGILPQDTEAQGMVKEYANLYAQYTINHSYEIKKKLENLENILREKGFTNKDFISLKTMVSNSIRKELAEQVKDCFLKRVLSKEKSIEMVVNEKSLNDVLDFALIKGLHDNESLQSVANDIRDEATEEIKDFTREKIEERLVRKHLTEDAKIEKKLDGEIKELLKLAVKAGVDLNQFTENWQIKQYDLGMCYINLGGNNADSQNQREKNNPYEFTKEDEKDILLARLRALHMHRALTGDWKTMLETHFKMRKLKNGLIKLGVTSNELAEAEKAGKAAARQRLLEALKATLEERATLYELAGPAFKLIEQKIKGILSNLERLGGKLDDFEFYSMRDAANLKVFDAARQELLTLKDMVKGVTNPGLEKRMSLVLKLMRRLKKESKLEAEIPGEESLITDTI